MQKDGHLMHSKGVIHNYCHLPTSFNSCHTFQSPFPPKGPPPSQTHPPKLNIMCLNFEKKVSRMLPYEKSTYFNINAKSVFSGFACGSHHRNVVKRPNEPGTSDENSSMGRTEVSLVPYWIGYTQKSTIHR